MTQSIWQKSYRSNLGEVENIVIGGGITGSSLAYWLNKGGQNNETIILEAGELASKASGRNAGFLLMGTAENYACDIRERGREMAKYLWEFSRDTIQLVGQHGDKELCKILFGGTIVAEPEQRHAQNLEESLVLMEEDGFEAELLSGKRLESDFGLRGMRSGLLIPRNGQVDPLQLVRHIAVASKAQIHTQREVNSIEQKGGKIEVSGSGFSARCERLFVATNAYLPKLVTATSEHIRPVRAQMLSMPGADLVKKPVYSHEGYFYYRQVADQVIIGGARHLHVDEEVGYDDLTTNHVQMDLEKYAREHIVGLEKAAAFERWSGTMGFTNDHLPKIGKIERLDNGYWIGGFSGHGLGFSFGLTKAAIEHLDGKNLGPQFAKAFLT